jgi:hypothetical protein
MNSKKYISVILVVLALAGSTVLLKLTAMNGNNHPQPMEIEEEQIAPVIEQNDPALEQILGHGVPGYEDAQPVVPAWFSEITQNIFHNRLHAAAAQIEALDPFNINYQDSEGWTLLHYAALKGRWAIAQQLLQKGINKNLVNHDGETAAAVADIAGNSDLAQMITDSP